jgi:hypothetical protein
MVGEATSADITAFDGHWRGSLNLDCTGLNAPMDVTIQGGDLSGKVTVRGQGEGDGTYEVSGYVDRRGKISDGRFQGPFIFYMSGSLSGDRGTGKFHGTECRGRFNITLEESTAPLQQDIATTKQSKEQQTATLKHAGGDQNLRDPQGNPLKLDFGSYHALVIGNNAYSDMPRLKTAIADADAIADVLEKRYAFTVTKMINATRYEIISAMATLRATLHYDANLLIYYAGHGIVDPVTERGYWLPVNAQSNNSANWVSNDDITDMLKAIPARHILVIADSCYSGTLTRAAPVELETWEDRRAWLKRIVEERSRTALASGGLEPVADSGSGGHSVFAAALLSALRENTEIVEAQALFAPVRKKVVLNANQTPVYTDIRLAGHEGGDFVFAPRYRRQYRNGTPSVK